VVQSDYGLHAILYTGIDHIVIMGQGKLVNVSLAEGKDPRPRDRDGVRWNSKGGNASNICLLVSY
jgi:hypothetical protein